MAPLVATPHFPTTTAKTLAGEQMSLPSAFPAERTLLLVAYQREQQVNIDTWTNGMKLATSSTPWFELPVINNPGAIARWFIDNGMRRGITNHDIWHHVITVYTKTADFNAAAGIDTEAKVHAIVVDRQGNILEHVIGDYSEAGAARLLVALGSKPTQSGH